jgi:hypothetical protein
MELGLKITGVFAGARPDAPDQGGLEPGSALARAVGSPLTGTLIVSRAQAGPGDPVSHDREAAHVGADLGADDLGAQVADHGNGGREQDRRAKGIDMSVDLPIDRTNGVVESIDLPEV